jgi:hypothetical protein
MGHRRFSNSVIALGMWFIILGMVLVAVNYGSSDLNWIFSGTDMAQRAGASASSVSEQISLFDVAGRLWPVPIVGAGALLTFIGIRRTAH